jgi:hypothetical protein
MNARQAVNGLAPKGSFNLLTTTSSVTRISPVTGSVLLSEGGSNLVSAKATTQMRLVNDAGTLISTGSGCFTVD